MTDANIFDLEKMKREIRASHKRSLKYGIDPKQKRNPNQVLLERKALNARRQKNKLFYGIGLAHIKELYHLFAGHGFCAVIADNEGYILDTICDEDKVEEFKEVNCAPGYRWVEEDVGSSAIAIVIATAKPIQITDRECHFARGFGYTNSAAPVFGLDNNLLGAIAITGSANKVHPHTLGMVQTTVKSIENQIRLERQSRELFEQNEYMKAILESISNGVIAVDRAGSIKRLNRSVENILSWPKNLIGQKITSIVGSDLDWQQFIRNKAKISNRELLIHKPDGDPIHVIVDIDPICDPNGLITGGLLLFTKIQTVHKLVHHIAGTQALLSFWSILGNSKQIQDTKSLAKQAAVGNSTVLISGETGTGKDLFAQAIHNESKRKSQPFVVINCGAIPRELLESELFGYVEGSFTGAQRGGKPGKLELANGGTVFLDEIGDMPAEMQVKILRVLQSGEICRIGDHRHFRVDLRFIAATNIDLAAEIERKNFRKDLFYRLNVFPISIPPLQERVEDILLLANHFLSQFRLSVQRPNAKFSKESERLLCAYHWPGNVRELANIVERAVNFAKGPIIEPNHLGISKTTPGHIRPERHDESSLELAEMEIIRAAIRQTENNIAKASKMLGISRPTMYNKLKKYDLMPAEKR